MSIKTFLTTLPLDKVAHFLGGAVIVALAMPFGPVIAGTALVIAALLKEIIDEVNYGGFDVKDFVVTVLGGALMMLWSGVVAGHIKA